MTDIVFEVVYKTERKIRLTSMQWKHVLKRHPYMNKYEEEIKETLKYPQKLVGPMKDLGYYYKYYKYLRSPNRYIFVLVKYLNGEGFVITTYQMENIKW